MRAPFSYITEKELVYAVVLSFLLLFLSFISFMRFEPTEMEGFYSALYGFPFPCMRTTSSIVYWFAHDVEILWSGLVLDFILYFLLSLTIVFLVVTLREKYF